MNTALKILFTGLIVTVLATPSLSAVNSHRPRIWIDSTVQARLQADATANTAEWAALKSWCDTNLAANNGGAYINSGYHGLQWYKAVMGYGLAFLATGDQTYGNEGVVYLTALLRDGVDSGTVGDGQGGDTAIQTDSGYVSRSLGTGVAVGRDWLDGATDLTPAIISEATGRMAAWYSWITNNAHAIDDPRDNYYYGHFTMFYTAGFSFYGDAGYDATWLTTAESKWVNEVLPIIDGGFYDGGDWAKGWNYAPWAVRELLGYLVARDTATDETGLWDGFNWHEDIAKSQLHFLYPSRNYFSDNGMWSGDIKGDPRSALARFVASMTPVGATTAGWLRWYSDVLAYEANGPSAWEAFLYKISDISSITPTGASVGGLAYTTNIGHFVARSAEWSDTNATMVEMFAYTDKPAAVSSGTNGDYNLGDMRIASRGESLIADGDRQQYTAHYNNLLMVTGNHTYAPYQEPWLKGKSSEAGYPEVSFITEAGDGYFYAKVKNLQNAYDGTYWTNTPSLAHYDRSQLFLPPDTVIVYDNATVSSEGNDVSIRWWFPRLPAVSGQTAMTSHPVVDLKMSIMGGEGSIAYPKSSQDLTAITRTTTYRDGFYFIDFETTDSPIVNQIFTIFTIADHGEEMPDSSTIVSSGAKGVLVEGKVAIFTSDENGGYISGASYSVDAETHYILDLPPETEVWIEKNGMEISGSPFLSSRSGVVTFMTQKGLASYGVSFSEPSGGSPGDPVGEQPTDPTGEQPTDPTGEQPTDPTGEQPSKEIQPPTIYVVPQ